MLTANGGVFFNQHCLQPDYNVMQCDIRVMEDKSPWLEGTKCVLLCGEAAMHEWVPNTKSNTINEMRGSPLYIGNMPAMASFFPQDCVDNKGYEQQLNVDSKNYSGEEDYSEDEDEGDVKTFSHTKRSNFGFWLKADVRKCKALLRQESPRWNIETEPTYKIFPQADEVVQVLQDTKDQYMDFDIETDYEDQNLLCFAFSFSDDVVYSVPILDHNYHFAYSVWPLIMRALAVAFRNNIVVAHNGAAFDFPVLAYKYGLTAKRYYDTMLSMHRCYPAVEKSLGHCVSLWTNQRFHKDTDSHSYTTFQHVQEKLKYCAKDVFTMRLVRKAIQKYESTIVGLSDSISCAQRSIRPYITTMLQGIRYSDEKVAQLKNENDRLMMQYIRIIEILIGPNGIIDLRKAVKGKAKAFPGSNKQCCEYFHNMLGYPVVARSKKTQEPSLGKKAMYKLALKFDNPVITFTMLYRQVQKEYGALNFIPWKNDDGTIVNIQKWIDRLAVSE